MIRCLAIIAVLALAGCGAAKHPAGTATQSASGTASAASTEIEELTDQRLIYECPKCGTMYSAAGTCRMDADTLVATRVDYVCPADGQPVAHAGQCPRCAVHARVQKTALAPGETPSTQ
jgi:predicted RNA-binding Zn-ribbon protein involved in translation (DUF1610 family)